MNVAVRQEAASKGGWDLPKSQPENEKVTTEIISRWSFATDELRKIANDNGWSKSEVCRRADMAVGTLSSWYDGTYKGRYDTTTAKVEAFIKSIQDTEAAARTIPKTPGYLETKTARELFDTFTYAQMLPTIAVVTLSAGMGKSEAAVAYQRCQ